MERYAPVAGADPFAASADLFTALTDELAGEEQAGLTEYELEDLVDGRGQEVLRQLLQDHLDLRAAREEQAARQDHPAATGSDGITRGRLETGHRRLLATLFGTVAVTRCAWRAREQRTCTRPTPHRPFRPGERSHALARLAALESARGSFDRPRTPRSPDAAARCSANARPRRR